MGYLGNLMSDGYEDYPAVEASAQPASNVAPQIAPPDASKGEPAPAPKSVTLVASWHIALAELMLAQSSKTVSRTQLWQVGADQMADVWGLGRGSVGKIRVHKMSYVSSSNAANFPVGIKFPDNFTVNDTKDEYGMGVHVMLAPNSEHYARKRFKGETFFRGYDVSKMPAGSASYATYTKESLAQEAGMHEVGEDVVLLKKSALGTFLEKNADKFVIRSISADNWLLAKSEAQRVIDFIHERVLQPLTSSTILARQMQLALVPKVPPRAAQGRLERSLDAWLGSEETSDPESRAYWMNMQHYVSYTFRIFYSVV